LSVYFDETLRKIRQGIEYWERFNLSLPGRISVCKTFLLSQIGYIGSIVSPTAEQEKNLQKALNDFCIGTMRTAAKKLYTPLSEGGLGLIKLSDFITSLQCSWVKRITQHWGDNWRYDFKRKCYGNPLIADRHTFDPRVNPILYNIGNSFGKFRSAFTEKDDNFRKALVFRNPFFRRRSADAGLLCENFFDIRNNVAMISIIVKLKFEDFFFRNRPKSMDNLNSEFGLDINLVTYMRLHEALQFAVDSRRNEEALPSQSLDFFLKSFEKGSKPFRRILRYKENSKLKICNLNTVKTFFELVSLPKPEDDILRFCWGEWQKNFYGNRCKEFLYKFRNNILGINQRVNKFVHDVDAECSLCTVNKEPRPIQVESFIHVFFECTYTTPYRVRIIETFFPELRGADEITLKRFWFTGIVPGMRRNNLFVSCIVNAVNYYIWNLKLKKSVNPLSIFIKDISDTVYKCLKMSKKLLEAKLSSNLIVCRHTFDPP
jgi:hypothetical protein